MLYKKTIKLETSGTLAVMKWIANNSKLAKNLDHTIFVNEQSRLDYLICTRLTKELFFGKELRKKIRNEGVEFYGIVRYYDYNVSCWYLLHKNDIYLLTN